ncbi:GCN5 family acetyltransferase [Pontibacillus chungwhensis BH030062]|uniref:GCN5 family acetyltransferase n=1 Tax=Pontibacillus chungwhensis BH030062 TaxID=1385513 RepID=A0A0A2UUZ9_9BACI|nr:GNAT family N-acetyltransferase [Pontibacillus chungwhensis]KGP90593.1 GCN5 family acetyltransferase [Pontibacillus chungwhensis BH030062]
MKRNLQIRDVSVNEIDEKFLIEFDRFQETKSVWYTTNQTDVKIKADSFIDHWSQEQKKDISLYLKRCIEEGGGVVAAFEGTQVAGFANVENRFFGSANQYVPLPFIHVSNSYRGEGIGKQLFYQCCEIAKDLGAEKIYIGAHPAVETQRFYQSVGCILAQEVNEDIYQKEPLDLQLEKLL